MNRYNLKCSDCKAKSADCAYGDLGGTESCKDAIENSLRKDNMLEYSKERIVDAIDYLEDFKTFAKNRMKALQIQLEEIKGCSGYIQRCDFVKIEIDEVYQYDGIQVLMQFGFYDSHSDALILSLDTITLPDAEWESYCKLHIQSAIDRKNEKAQRDNEKAREDRMAQYVKLREEFEDG